MNLKEKSKLKKTRYQSRIKQYNFIKSILYFRLYTQLNNQNYSRDDNSKIEQKLGLLETQMNAKILQMQNKKAKLFKMKKNQDSLGTFEAAMNFRLELGNDAVTLFYCFLFQEPGVKACHHSTTL